MMIRQLVVYDPPQIGPTSLTRRFGCLLDLLDLGRDVAPIPELLEEPLEKEFAVLYLVGVNAR